MKLYILQVSSKSMNLEGQNLKEFCVCRVFLDYEVCKYDRL